MKKSTKHSLFALISIIFLVLGIYFLSISTQALQFLPFEDNLEFSIQVTELFNDEYIHPDLEHLVISYDFENQEGQIFFKIKENRKDNRFYNIDEVDIGFPKKLINESVEVNFHTCDNHLCDNIIATSNLSRFIRLHFGEDNMEIEPEKRKELTLTSDELIEIKFRLVDFFPNGEITIKHIDNFIDSSSSMIILNLGQLFVCKNDCIYDPHNVRILDRRREGDINTLRLKLEDSDKKDYYIFDIETISRKDDFNRDLFLSLGVSMIVASIMFLLQAFYMWFVEEEDKNAKKKTTKK